MDKSKPSQTIALSKRLGELGVGDTEYFEIDRDAAAIQRLQARIHAVPTRGPLHMRSWRWRVATYTAIEQGRLSEALTLVRVERIA